MKKFLLCMLLAGLMMPVVAQEKTAVKQNEKRVAPMLLKDAGGSTYGAFPMTSRGTLVEVELWTSAGISQSYDRQTQGGVYPMVQMHKDKKFIGCTWTNEDNPPFDGSGTPIRGLGYSYSTDGGETWSWNNEETRENRLGGIPVYWPSYAQWGKNGEAVMARSYDSYEYDDGYNDVYIKDGLVLFTRENRGEGAWTITPVPYPEDSDPKHFMAWGAMTTSGDDHQYIHIITPMSNQDIPNVLYHGYGTPTLYFRTQDGKTWDVAGQPVPEVIGQVWDEESYYADGMSWAVQGNTVACSFINMGSHGYVIKSLDNGDTWQSIKFFDAPVRSGVSHNEYPDSVYVPSVGCLALDNNGKMHVAFSAIRCMNGDDGIYYNPGGWAQFLSYWNEDMTPINGDTDFNTPYISSLLMGHYYYDGEYFDWDLSDGDQFYVKSTIPKWPVIGYFIPFPNEHLYTMLDDADEWAGKSYGQAGMFSFPQMTFDANNVLHLVYLGMLDGAAGGLKNGAWLRHPFYTTTDDGGKTWTQTEYLVNYVTFVDQEFAYPVFVGVSADDKMFMMAQTDPMPGTNGPYGTNPPDHSAIDNSYTFFTIAGVPCPDCPGNPGIVENTLLSMQLLPNPASGQVKVTFEGKGDIAVYNMLGQTVYHVENVENHKDIPLNMASGVYFVTVRSGNAMATQKLVVK